MNNECVSFLQWALPQLRMRWPGFRKIHTRVCKRINQRLNTLQINNFTDYQAYLHSHREEWQKLDELCRVTISRFYRDKMVFTHLQLTVLPTLAMQAVAHGEKVLQVWSAGCACGEEPYTLALMWDICLKERFPQLQIHILATDINEELLERAVHACYPFSSVKNLPLSWRVNAFRETNNTYCLNAEYKHGVSFQCKDIRDAVPVIHGPFDLILCRNLVFTYYDQALQIKIGERLLNNLKSNGALVIGVHEALPKAFSGVEPWSQRLGIYCKVL